MDREREFASKNIVNPKKYITEAQWGEGNESGYTGIQPAARSTGIT